MSFRGLLYASAPLLSLLLAPAACGGADERSRSGSAGQTAAGQAGTPSSGGSTAGTGVGGATQAGAGASSTGGSASGGATGGASTGGVAETGGAAGANGGTASGAAPGFYDCDARKILCKRVAPECPANQVPSVSGSCYGDCVPIMQCGCTGAAECPDSNQYTCWSQQHCGPYVR